VKEIRNTVRPMAAADENENDDVPIMPGKFGIVNNMLS
jgi:enhancing lycopene biosynthesis protein 2